MRIMGQFEQRISDNACEYRCAGNTVSLFGGTVPDTVRIIGENLPEAPRVRYYFDGAWKEDGFVATNVEDVPPKSLQEICDFLQYRLGLSAEITRTLAFRYGVDTMTMLRTDIEYITDTLDIARWQKREIKKAWGKYTSPALFSFLSSFGVSDNQTAEVLDRFEETAMNVVSRSPYKLVNLSGLPFRTCDEIALAGDINWNSDMRIRAGVTEALRQFETGGNDLFRYGKATRTDTVTGNTCMTEDQVLPFAKFILENEHPLSDDDVKAAVEGYEGIVLEDGVYSRKEISLQEAGTAKNIRRLLEAKTGSVELDFKDILSRSDELIRKGGLAGTPSEEQAKAVSLALKNPVAIITGGPGTGKTTIQTALIYLLEQTMPGVTIRMLAPTGRAASRMKESSGRDAQTIHSALGLDLGNEGEPKTLEEDVIIVDEFSMVDSWLAEKLFSSVKSGSKIVCIGDINQLPSVGAGCVLRDMIASGVVPTAKLTGVFRQKNGSSVVDNAYKINNGQEDLVFDESFVLEEAKGNDIQKKVIERYKKEVEKYGLEHVCILTPFRKSTETGSDMLNEAIQREFMQGDEGPTIKRFGNTYHVGDKVMFRKNRNGLANGDVGIIEEISDGAMFVDFGRDSLSRIESEDLDDVTLSYAVTIHKSQGSEYKSVILVMDPRHRVMHKKALVYTAVTRAKAQVYTIGSVESLKISVHAEDTSLRKSLLCGYLRTEFGKRRKAVNRE